MDHHVHLAVQQGLPHCGDEHAGAADLGERPAVHVTGGAHVHQFHGPAGAGRQGPPGLTGLGQGQG